MPNTRKGTGTEIFNAASSPLRMQILALLSTKGPLPYIEIMSSQKLDPIRDAGKFVYHLKSLSAAGLIKLDKEAKKYAITELGGMVVNFARDLEEYVAVKKGELYVRASRLAIEEFDRDKIAASLIREAGVPRELAQEIAAEAEERLIKLKVTYLTSPLIREFVNAILIERKLEEYRHKLTRLGMPVHDVTQLLKTTSEKKLNVDAVRSRAGQSVMEEYILLNCLPRTVSDAHLSGEIHIDNIGFWILKPKEVQHDLRIIFEHSLPNMAPPKNFESALLAAQNMFRLSSAETTGEQCFDFFNVFLAPFIGGLPRESVKEAIRLFLLGLQQNWSSEIFASELSLGFEFQIPEFLRNVEAIGPKGVREGVYGDYLNEAKLILELSVEAALEASTRMPLFNPQLIFKLRNGFSEEIKADLLKVHSLSAQYSLPYFAGLKGDSRVGYTASGLRLDDGWRGSWETDCLRTGSVGTVFINLPRIAYESHGNDDKFLSSLRERMKLAVEAFEAKDKSIEKRFKELLLPALSGFGETLCFQMGNAAHVVSYIGLYEAIHVHTGSAIHVDQSSHRFALRVVNEISRYVSQVSQELDRRFMAAQLPGSEAAVRLAELDLDKYGSKRALVHGVKGYPYYTDMSTLPLSTKISLDGRLGVEGGFQSATPGGHIMQICLTPTKHEAEDLLKLTKHACSKDVRFFTYSSNYSSCGKCNQTFLDILQLCPRCGSSNLVYYGRESAKFKPVTLWLDAKRRDLGKRVCYSKL